MRKTFTLSYLLFFFFLLVGGLAGCKGKKTASIQEPEVVLKVKANDPFPQAISLEEARKQDLLHWDALIQIKDSEASSLERLEGIIVYIDTNVWGILHSSSVILEQSQTLEDILYPERKDRLETLYRFFSEERQSGTHIDAVDACSHRLQTAMLSNSAVFLNFLGFLRNLALHEGLSCQEKERLFKDTLLSKQTLLQKGYASIAQGKELHSKSAWAEQLADFALDAFGDELEQCHFSKESTEALSSIFGEEAALRRAKEELEEKKIFSENQAEGPDAVSLPNAFTAFLNRFFSLPKPPTEDELDQCEAIDAQIIAIFAQYEEGLNHLGGLITDDGLIRTFFDNAQAIQMINSYLLNFDKQCLKTYQCKFLRISQMIFIHFVQKRHVSLGIPSESTVNACLQFNARLQALSEKRQKTIDDAMVTVLSLHAQIEKLQSENCLPTPEEVIKLKELQSMHAFWHLCKSQSIVP